MPNLLRQIVESSALCSILGADLVKISETEPIRSFLLGKLDDPVTTCHWQPEIDQFTQCLLARFHSSQRSFIKVNLSSLLSSHTSGYRFTYLLLYLLLQIGPIVAGKTVPNRPLLSLERFKTQTFLPAGKRETDRFAAPIVEMLHRSRLSGFQQSDSTDRTSSIDRRRLQTTVNLQHGLLLQSE